MRRVNLDSLTTGQKHNCQFGNKVLFKPICREPLIMPKFPHFRMNLVNWSDFHEKKTSFQVNGPFLKLTAEIQDQQIQ